MGLAPVQAGQRLTAALINSLPVSPAPFIITSYANSAAEVSIGQVTVPAGDAVYSYGYVLRALCTVGTTGTPTFAPRLHVNGLASPSISSPPFFTCRTGTNLQLYLDCTIWVTADGPTGTVANMGVWVSELASPVASFEASGASVAAVDTTQPWTLMITGQFGTASASNTAQTLAGSLSRA